MIGRTTLKPILLSLLGGILFLTACGQTSSVTPTATIPIIKSATATPSPNPTNTSIPTESPTATITPLPTIPTFTPTFDARTILTVTPAPKAECPKEDSNLTPDLNALFNKEFPIVLRDQPVLDFLNSGGTRQKLITLFRQHYRWLDSNVAIQQDITGDGVAEIILTDGYIVYVFGCEDKKYQTLLSYTDDPAWMQEIQFNIVKDMNLNGFPEIITVEYGGHTEISVVVSIFEWNGLDFFPLIQGRAYDDNHFSFADTPVLANVNIRDVDGDRTLELILESDLPTPIPSIYTYLMPWRNEIDIYAWNGTHYILNRTEYSSPEFRFQALQDADREISYGGFDKALLLYQEVILSKKLRTFSREILGNEIAKSSAIEDINQPTPTSVSPDPTEYPRLAAYAYYRIVLLQLVQNHESEATTVYNTLQKKFSNDQYGRPYAEMATAFWETYQSAHKMYDGCAAAIQYAVEHPEILTPLGSDFHGSQSHIYVPADVCPFR